MECPVSPIACNLYMEQLEQLAVSTAPHPPLWWYRYVDDTRTKLKKQFAHEFTDHLNSLDGDIKFTTEAEDNRTLTFLDTLTVIKPDGSLDITIYRKPACFIVLTLLSPIIEIVKRRNHTSPKLCSSVGTPSGLLTDTACSTKKDSTSASKTDL